MVIGLEHSKATKAMVMAYVCYIWCGKLWLLDYVLPTKVDKNGDKNTKENYSPIDFLFSLSKIIEKLLYTQLMDFFNISNVLQLKNMG